jgi:hypothetical protein
VLIETALNAYYQIPDHLKPEPAKKTIKKPKIRTIKTMIRASNREATDA